MLMLFLGAGITVLCVYFFLFIQTVVQSLDKAEQRRFAREGMTKEGFVKTLVLWVAFFYFKDPLALLLIGLAILGDWWWDAKRRHRKLLALGFPQSFERRLWSVGYLQALGQTFLMLFVAVRHNTATVV